MIRAVQCTEFAVVEKVNVDNGDRPKFQRRAKAKKLKEVLKLAKIRSPTLTANDQNKVLIETRYAGIQYPDALQAQGKILDTFSYSLFPNLTVFVFFWFRTIPSETTP